jgi:hypothetical protein
MKFCQPHWDALRTAVEARGLGHLIAANGRDAVARTVADFAGRADVSDFDPLMSAHWMIAERATQVLGLALYCGDLCPVCELLTVTPPPPPGHRYATNDAYFIDGPADAVLARCQELGIATPTPTED